MEGMGNGYDKLIPSLCGLAGSDFALEVAKPHQL